MPGSRVIARARARVLRVRASTHDPSPSPPSLPRVLQSTAGLVSLSLIRRHPCPFAVKQLYGVNYSGREVERSRRVEEEEGGWAIDRSTDVSGTRIDRFISRRLDRLDERFLTSFLLSAGPAATQPAIQVHGRRVLRQDQGGVQLPAGAVPLVSSRRSRAFCRYDIGATRRGEKRRHFPICDVRFSSLSSLSFLLAFSSDAETRAQRLAASRIARAHLRREKRSGNGRSCGALRVHAISLRT